MNLFEEFTQYIQKIAQNTDLIKEIDINIFSRITVEPPRDPSHGDMATNAAMELAKPAGLNPRAIAGQIAEALELDPRVASVAIAGPGFINFSLKQNAWNEVLAQALTDGRHFGSGQPPGSKVNVEYVSANPTGPMHIGHCRGAVFGDALANLLKFAGDEVTKEYYTNDAGAQVDVLARSAFLRYREALGEDIGAIPEGLYPGNYLVPVGKTLAEHHGNSLLSQSEAEWLPVVKEATMDAMMAMIRDDLNSLGVRHDVFFSEKSLHAPLAKGSDESRISQVIADLR